jgi:formiminoglutamase
MMDLRLFFQPSRAEQGQWPNGSIGQAVDGKSIPETMQEIPAGSVVIMGVCEDRGNPSNQGSGKGPDAIRPWLYRLSNPLPEGRLFDFGNIEQGHAFTDTHFALSEVSAALLKQGALPLVLGGTQDLTYAQFKAYEKLEQTVNLVGVDALFNMGEIDQPLDSQSYLSHIILHQPNFLFNYSHIGYQTYLVEQASIALMDKLYFDAYRLGLFKNNVFELEPILRNADLVSFDLSCIRASDAPGNSAAGPNGFYGEEACQMMRYAGLSEKLSSLGIFEFNPLLDSRGFTAHLVAQMVWCFLEGVASRKSDYPIASKQEFTRYRVFVQEGKHEIVFYKSNRTDRWWMEVPYPPDKGKRFERHHLVPCSYSDYQLACREDIPDRWWQTFQKLG